MTGLFRRYGTSSAVENPPGSVLVTGRACAHNRSRSRRVPAAEAMAFQAESTPGTAAGTDVPERVKSSADRTLPAASVSISPDPRWFPCWYAGGVLSAFAGSALSVSASSSYPPARPGCVVAGMNGGQQKRPHRCRAGGSGRS